MTLSSDVPKRRFNIRYSDLLIDGIHIEGITWRLRFAVQVGEQDQDDESKTRSRLEKPDDELMDCLKQIGIETQRVRDGLMLEAITGLKHGPAGLACLLDTWLHRECSEEHDKRLLPRTTRKEIVVI